MPKCFLYPSKASRSKQKQIIHPDIKKKALAYSTGRKNQPVKEGGQQPPKQHLVSGPCAHMTVHQLGPRDIHRSTCKECTRNEKQHAQPTAKWHRHVSPCMTYLLSRFANGCHGSCTVMRKGLHLMICLSRDKYASDQTLQLSVGSEEARFSLFALYK